MQQPAAAAVPMEPVAQLLLAASLVLAEQELTMVVLQQAAAQQVVAVVRQRILRQRLRQRLRQNNVYQVSVWETRDITQRTVIITALMEQLDANVQIHTNAQLGQLS